MIIHQDEYAYNDYVSRMIGISPFEIVYVMHPRGVCELKDLGVIEYRSGHVKYVSQNMKEI